MDNLLSLYKKYKMQILYLFFGGVSTVINIVIYFICAYLLKLDTAISTIIAWLTAVIIAFITNKFFVFESKSTSIFHELYTFFACRIGTGLLDLAVMCITVDILHWNDLLMKIISNVIVVILNYILSKLIVFKNK